MERILRSPGSVLFSTIFSVILTLFSLVAPLGAVAEAKAKEHNASKHTKKSVHVINSKDDNNGHSNVGAIWTTDKDGSQNINHYDFGDSVYLHGQNFSEYAGDSLVYQIFADPPNPHGDAVKEGTVNVASNGDIQVQLIWVVDINDNAEYKVVLSDTSGTKSDNFQVKGVVIPETHANLELSKVAPDTAKPLDLVTDTVTIKNTGDASATNQTLTYKINKAIYVNPDTNPFGGTAFVSYTGPVTEDDSLVYQVKIVDLAPGAIFTLDYTYTVAANTPNNEIIKDTATIGDKSACAETKIVVDPPACQTSKVVLAPISSLNKIDTDHTVTATVTDSDNKPISDVTVHFQYVSSLYPDAIVELGTASTDSNGQASFTMHGPKTEQTWTITAWYYENIETECQNLVKSNMVTKQWIKGGQGGDGGDDDNPTPKPAPKPEETTNSPILPAAGPMNASTVLLITSLLLIASYALRGYLFTKNETTRKNILTRLVEVEK